MPVVLVSVLGLLSVAAIGSISYLLFALISQKGSLIAVLLSLGVLIGATGGIINLAMRL